MLKVNQFIGAALICLSFLSIADSSLSADDLVIVKKIVDGACIACHDADGNSQILLNPKLASQHPAYLTKQLINFKTGIRKNAIMAGMVMNLSIRDMENLGIYFSEKKISLSKAKENGKDSMGEKIFRAGIKEKEVPACAACHGPSGHGIPDLYPRLNAQNSEYTITQLNLFRDEGRPSEIMQKISQKLTKKEMEAVADYVQGLR
jgi:cytochrome c553